MTCECCHCCFCCCEQNYDNNPNPTKKPKVETPVTRTTQIPKPPVVTDRSEPVIKWPDELIPGPPTVEEWMERPPIEIIRANNDAAEEEEQFSFPPKTTEPPPPVLGCMDPLATNYNPLATQNDGSCIYPPPPPVLGCMDPLATNYNPLATQNDGSCIYPPPACPVYKQYTSDQALIPGTAASMPTRMDNSTTLSQTINADQGPPSWIPQTDWDLMEWDGIPLADPYGKTPAQLCAWMFKGRAMKGLKQKYEAFKPFCDPTRPTIAEIDNWHLEVIKHFRALLGVTTSINLDERLYLEAAWAEERFNTNYWDSKYTGTQNTAYGPCRVTTNGVAGAFSTNQHCGASFIPSLEDQARFYTQYPGLTPTMMQTSRAEGIGTQNTNLPWMLKLVGQLQNWVCSEGLVGHAGPFVTRTKVGISTFTSSNGSSANTRFRIKWS